MLACAWGRQGELAQLPGHEGNCAAVSTLSPQRMQEAGLALPLKCHKRTLCKLWPAQEYKPPEQGLDAYAATAFHPCGDGQPACAECTISVLIGQ